MEDVLLRIGEKMVRRHPHVFDANYKSNTDDGAIGAWEARKARERGMDTSALDGVPNSLPALLRSYRIAEKASAVGFDWPSIDGIQEKLNEELEELNEALATGDEFAIESEFGDVLLSLVNLSRFLPTDPENALKGATNRFEKRFRHVEHTVAKTGGTVHDTPLDELERLWQQAKEET